MRDFSAWWGQFEGLLVSRERHVNSRMFFSPKQMGHETKREGDQKNRATYGCASFRCRKTSWECSGHVVARSLAKESRLAFGSRGGRGRGIVSEHEPREVFTPEFLSFLLGEVFVSLPKKVPGGGEDRGQVLIWLFGECHGRVGAGGTQKSILQCQTVFPMQSEVVRGCSWML